MDYDLVVIGGGSAGLTASGLGAQAGAKTLLVEQHRLGGDCTWTGCVPSKTLIKAAKVAWQVRHASKYGLTDQPLAPGTRGVMAHLRRTRDAVYEEADRPERYEAFGVEVRTARARFIDPHLIELESDGAVERVSARYVIIATGARPSIPPIEGLQDVPYLTNETLFELDELPRRIAILGAGPIGTEMAQALNRLGSDVT
ncbi:MAG TPA: FAD-dependent oxidoreductase, partial [Rhodothermales bacterium]|nr:FAD-dependent oxidoreductase [Rhodothermales bacterium]